MAARKRKKQGDGATVKADEPKIPSESAAEKEAQKTELDAKIKASKVAELKEMHLTPLPLVITVLVCSGALWIFALRDFIATGRVIGGAMDEAMQVFTKSTSFFDISRGWFKSTAGGLSTIKSVTTDENNMGGLFVRKAAGVVALTVHTQKLSPLLFHPVGAEWAMGHFIPVLATGVVGNLGIVAFYQVYMNDLELAGADAIAKLFCGILSFEALVMFLYLLSAWRKARVAAPRSRSASKKSPNAVTSRIVARTVALVSGIVTIIAARDLFLPGSIITFIPRDDVYLEWTGALIHSPPSNTDEYYENSLEAPLYIGDKFISQLLALHLLICCFQKFTAGFFIKAGKNKSGEIKCKMFWKVHALGDGLLLFLFRLSAAAALSASLDLRWHLMIIAYEAFILGLFAFF
mmetsp:Transcript_22613/g.40806  ORF Transcript_22613/g.40806 Transcript_22613/m.40806 type:complete len:406 (-) Transcript_22613:136-1353(-)|eukprot:CAMPEP_0198293578 /NCGR_PEP_ID=MMETSP1449-20131203/17817_1 /TAXON_ID=420275 /ORGANISM="Attheya septentrionalis, Strain CCMP2084" /LENGTH=405 /DNA_ID=CAMNT_0043993207 /DNA_START=149 /DNA_END=1366 /DNA_ORIENTATION=-